VGRRRETSKPRPIEVTEDVLTVDELAAYWGVTPQSVQKAAWEGTIPGCAKVLGSFVFDKEVVLDNWVPSSVQSWASDLNAITKSSGLTIEGGRKAIRDAALARLHDLHVLVSPARWAKIILAAVDQAALGDWRARKWLGDYLMGPPVKRVEAEIDVKTSHSYTDEMRAQAIEALLGQAGGRTIVDVSSRQVKDPDACGKEPS
jgi:hypothetical protein